MPVVLLEPADLTPFAADIDQAKAEAMIADALALAARVAPCISEETFAYGAAAKAILRGAVLRWHEAGSGALQSETAGTYSYSVDNRQTRRGMFWPSEIEQLQALCSNGEQSGAFAIDTVSTGGALHADICSLNFGALYCSCGAVLTQGAPLYEVEP